MASAEAMVNCDAGHTQALLSILDHFIVDLLGCLFVQFSSLMVLTFAENRILRRRIFVVGLNYFLFLRLRALSGWIRLLSGSLSTFVGRSRSSRAEGRLTFGRFSTSSLALLFVIFDMIITLQISFSFVNEQIFGHADSFCTGNMILLLFGAKISIALLLNFLLNLIFKLLVTRSYRICCLGRDTGTLRPIRRTWSNRILGGRH